MRLSCSLLYIRTCELFHINTRVKLHIPAWQTSRHQSCWEDQETTGRKLRVWGWISWHDDRLQWPPTLQGRFLDSSSWWSWHAGWVWSSPARIQDHWSWRWWLFSSSFRSIWRLRSSTALRYSVRLRYEKYFSFLGCACLKSANMSRNTSELKQNIFASTTTFLQDYCCASPNISDWLTIRTSST